MSAAVAATNKESATSSPECQRVPTADSPLGRAVEGPCHPRHQHSISEMVWTLDTRTSNKRGIAFDICQARNLAWVIAVEYRIPQAPAYEKEQAKETSDSQDADPVLDFGGVVHSVLFFRPHRYRQSCLGGWPASGGKYNLSYRRLGCPASRGFRDAGRCRSHPSCSRITDFLSPRS